MAQDFGLEGVAEQTGLGKADLKQSGTSLMNWSLGMVALLAVLVIIFGGVNWMISGDSEPVKIRSKNIIFWAVIGLIVILLSWAIVFFVANTASEVTR